MKKYIWQKKNWPNFTWKKESLFQELIEARKAQATLHEKIRILGLENSKTAIAERLTEEIKETSRIEGIHYTEESIRSSVAKKLGLSKKGLPPTQDTIEGLLNALTDATEKYDEALRLKEINKWHAWLFPEAISDLVPIKPGKMRTTEPVSIVSGPIGHEVVHYEAPPGEVVKTQMKEFIVWFNMTKEDGLIKAAVAQFYFVSIHPYEDGNGRLGRIITEKALARDEKIPHRFYSLSAELMKSRKDYYAQLTEAQHGNGDLTEWISWFLRAYKNAIQNSETLISKSLTKAKFWQKHAQTEINPRQKKVLNKILDKGISEFEGGITTRKYAHITKTSRATAYRELADLVQKKVLTPTPTAGRNTSYTIIP